MRIGLNSPDPQVVTTEQTSTSSSSACQTGRSAGESDDTFSSDTVTASGLANQVLQMPDVRQAKIDSLQQSIANGQYEVDAKGTAEAMLSQ